MLNQSKRINQHYIYGLEKQIISLIFLRTFIYNTTPQRKPDIITQLDSYVETVHVFACYYKSTNNSFFMTDNIGMFCPL